MDAATIRADFYEHVEMTERWTPADQPCNYMSTVGHVCDRYLFYVRKEGRQRKPFPLKALLVMREGKEHERRAKADLMAAGYQWYEEQQSVVNHKLELRGKHDGFLGKNGGRTAAEIKSVNQWTFEKIRAARTEEAQRDVLLDPEGWQRRGAIQFNAYLLELGEASGVFVFRNRNDGDLEPVDFYADTALWSEMAERLKKVNKAVKTDTPPDRIDGTGTRKVCEGCAFAHICLPDLVAQGPGITFEDDPETIRRLDRIAELQPLAKELDDLTGWRKEHFLNRDGVSCGKWLVEGKWINFTRKPQEAKEVEYWRVKVVNTEGA